MAAPGGGKALPAEEHLERLKELDPSLSLTHALSLSLKHTASLTLSLSRTHTRTHAHTHTLSHTHTPARGQESAMAAAGGGKALPAEEHLERLKEVNPTPQTLNPQP